MKTTIYWTILRGRRVADELRFRATCWWLSQQVEFLEWRLRLEALMPQAQFNPTPVSDGQASQYAVNSM